VSRVIRFPGALLKALPSGQLIRECRREHLTHRDFLIAGKGNGLFVKFFREFRC
jgi:hypothetical protein